MFSIAFFESFKNKLIYFSKACMRLGSNLANSILYLADQDTKEV